MREYGFELSLCARLEAGPGVRPCGVAPGEAVIARQVGGGVERPGGRVLDVVLVEPGPEFDRRAAITAESIPLKAIEADVGPGRWRRPTGALSLPPERARAVCERAVEVGFFERTRRDGDAAVRQVTRYPEWFGRIVAIENKPDLGSPGALQRQLRTDVSLGAVDAAVVATESHVTGAHRNRIPEEVGIWRVREEGVEVVREPTPLDPGSAGVELLERRPGRAEVTVVDAAEKRRARRRVAERAYGKGWRPDRLPACANAREGTVAAGGGLPDCAYKGRLVDPGRECGPECPGYEPADLPETDPDGERDRRTPWRRDPPGLARRQAGLDRFG